MLVTLSRPYLVKCHKYIENMEDEEILEKVQWIKKIIHYVETGDKNESEGN